MSRWWRQFLDGIAFGIAGGTLLLIIIFMLSGCPRMQWRYDRDALTENLWQRQ